MGNEFRKFIARGNVMDLAVGIVIGAAFTSVVNSFVADILMPPIGVLTGGVDFANLFIDLSGVGYASLAEAREAGAATINYGAFHQQPDLIPDRRVGCVHPDPGIQQDP